MNDLHHLLPGGNAAHHIAADTLRLDSFDEFGGNVDVDVRLKQGKTDFAHRISNVRFGERTLPAKLAEYVVQFVTQ